jgi:hypothetical protein
MDAVYKNAPSRRPVTGFAISVGAIHKQIDFPSFDKLDKFLTAMVSDHLCRRQRDKPTASFCLA